MGESKINETAIRVRRHFSERLLGLRKGEKLSQDEFGATLGLSRGSVSYYENQSRTAPIDVLFAVADHFNVSADYLLGIKETPEPYIEIEKAESGSPGSSRCASRVADDASALVPRQAELWSAFARSSLLLPRESGLRDSLFATVMSTIDAYMVVAQSFQSGEAIPELILALQSAGVPAELSMSILSQVSKFQLNNGSSVDGYGRQNKE